jgi:hypothetical protein
MATASISDPNPVPPRRRAAFVARIRGDLGSALQSPETFVGIAPAVPRSTAWLSDRTLSSLSALTARDIALFETLVARYVTSEETVDTIRAARLCPVKHALTVLSVGGRTAQPRELVDALHRLFGRERTPLKRSAAFTFHLPAWMIDLQKPGTRYGYLDLAVLARFRRRSSTLLYRDIVGHVASEGLRYEPGAKPTVLAYSPAGLARVLGMAEPVHVGQLRLNYLAPALAEIAEHVRSFEVVSVTEKHEPRRKAGEIVMDGGKPTEARAISMLLLTVRLRPPERLETAAVRAIDKPDFKWLAERGDGAPYAIRPETLVRLGTSLPSQIGNRKKSGAARPLLASEMQGRYGLWLSAIHEALTGATLTPAFETRATRGQRLLDLIATEGADKAFWAFSHEEADAPDLGPRLHEQFRLLRQGEDARKARFAAEKGTRAKASRKAVREPREEGTIAPARKRTRMTESPTKAAEVASIPVMGPPSVVEPRAVDGAGMLATPEAKEEAGRLYREWQIGYDLPFAHAGDTARRIKAAFPTEYPTLAAADAAMKDVYILSLGPLVRGSRENIPGSTWREQDDNFSHYVAILARAWPLSVMNGSSQDPAAKIAGNRSVYERDRARHQAIVDAARLATEQKRKGAVGIERAPGGFRGDYKPKRSPSSSVPPG